MSSKVRYLPVDQAANAALPDGVYAVYRDEPRKKGERRFLYSPNPSHQPVSTKRTRGWASIKLAREALETGRWDGLAQIVDENPGRCSVAPDSGGRGAVRARVEKALATLGLVGDLVLGFLLYLAVSSRVFDDPVSVAVKGSSSTGKSLLVGLVLKLFPAEAAIVRTAMSERALLYSAEELRHRTLVLFEDDGAQSTFTAYILRSLLSEGCLRYETTIQGEDGRFTTQRIEKEGPTNLLLTSTAVALHPENETRLLSVTTSDSPEATRNVLRALAVRDQRVLDLTSWHDLQARVAAKVPRVDVPFALQIADLSSCAATRMRRDFSALLCLVRTHALIRHGLSNSDLPDVIEATLDDYEAVHEVVSPWYTQSSEATVSEGVREVVNAVCQLTKDGHHAGGVGLRLLASWLNRDKSTISRRVKEALSREFLEDRQVSKGRPMKLLPLVAALPGEEEVFPSRARVEAALLGETSSKQGID